MNPREFYFHCMAGREGICDTATGTAKSGYIQRRIVKLCEDLVVKYDGTVRDFSNNVYQMTYGDVGMDASQYVFVRGKPQVCDISRLVNKLNKHHKK